MKNKAISNAKPQRDGPRVSEVVSMSQTVPQTHDSVHALRNKPAQQNGDTVFHPAYSGLTRPCAAHKPLLNPFPSGGGGGQGVAGWTRRLNSARPPKNLTTSHYSRCRSVVVLWVVTDWMNVDVTGLSACA